MSSLKPVSRDLNSTITSGVLRTSKTWVLPPRTKPGRRPRTHWRHDQETEETDQDLRESSKKAKNRDAQRAFRERQTKQLAELHEEVAKWSQKCAFYKQELDKHIQQVKRLEGENQELAARVNKLENNAPKHNELEKCDMCTQDLCICQEVGLRPQRDAALEAMIATLTPSLWHKIDTFRPMQAVALPQSLQARRKRKKGPETSGNFPVLKKSAPSVELDGVFPSLRVSKTSGVPESAGSNISMFKKMEGSVNSFEASSPHDSGPATAVSESLDFPVESEGCGFCSETSACLCRDQLGLDSTQHICQGSQSTPASTEVANDKLFFKPRAIKQ
ncbi:LAME_0F07800g1_1 [Lachancea meyersii CBS 8951]|uniref:LAME_0F07800g1_1 n=1 Tax=Lachancea meyersii CBS 8951 TaxID=1266667 RepID=A0A1G4JUA0_9SACH|nr:LAME_0F07800g1_1 [Lachancea meyersii CBS 8951]